MGKGYKGVPCVYCQIREACTADHVIARAFLPENKRDDLPKVPACEECNSAKSKLEHALTAIMPFGGRHVDAGQALEKAGRMLARNEKLQANLSRGVGYSIRSINGGPWHFEMTVAADLSGIEKLFQYIVKGLAYHHWKIALGSEHFVRASYLNEVGRSHFDPWFENAVHAKVSQNLGDGAFFYEGVQAADCPELTVWRMSIFGALVGGAERRPGDRNSMAYGISTPRTWSATAMLMELLGE